jgi:hypothetical protein
MAKPQHLEAMKAVVGVFARDVVGAYLAGPSAQPPPAVATAAAAAQQLRWVCTLWGRQGQALQDDFQNKGAGCSLELVHRSCCHPQCLRVNGNALPSSL